MSIVNYESKYLKYKTKYEELKKQHGGLGKDISKYVVYFVYANEENLRTITEWKNQKQTKGVITLEKLNEMFDLQGYFIDDATKELYLIERPKTMKGLFSKKTEEEKVRDRRLHHLSPYKIIPMYKDKEEKVPFDRCNENSIEKAIHNINANKQHTNINLTHRIVVHAKEFTIGSGTYTIYDLQPI